jgi:phosphomevalonate kinase
LRQNQSAVRGSRTNYEKYLPKRFSLGGERCTIVRISGPLKRLYAQNHKLDFQELLSDGPYKEIYRVDMINWSDKIREKDPGYFCKAASEMAEKKIGVDCRRCEEEN